MINPPSFLSIRSLWTSSFCVQGCLDLFLTLIVLALLLMLHSFLFLILLGHDGLKQAPLCAQPSASSCGFLYRFMSEFIDVICTY